MGGDGRADDPAAPPWTGIESVEEAATRGVLVGALLLVAWPLRILVDRLRGGLRARLQADLAARRPDATIRVLREVARAGPRRIYEATIDAGETLTVEVNRSDDVITWRAPERPGR